MKKVDASTAEVIMTRSAEIGSLLGQLGEILRQSDDEQYRLSTLRVVGGMMGDIWIHIQRPIVKDYPELDPDKPT